jgi:hypothetical protein
MALINTSVPNLIQGVSQQPDATRFDGQCEEQENALSSVAEGLKKRPNTRHVARLLEEAIDDDSFVHFINRSDEEKYVVIHDTNSLQVWNLDGTPCTINGAASYNQAGSYLVTQNPLKDLKALTIADGTFLLNSEQQVGLDSTHSPELEKEALVFVKQGDYSKKYNLHLEGSFATGGASGDIAAATINMIPSGGNNMKVGSVTITDGGTLYEAGTTTTFSIPTEHTTLAGANPYTLNTLSDAVFEISVNSNGTIQNNVNILNAGSYQYKSTNLLNQAFYETSSFTETTTVSAPTGTGPSTETVVEAESSSTDADTQNILTLIETEFVTNFPVNNNTDDDFTTHKEGNLLVITRDNNKTDFKISGSDGLADTGLGVVYKEVNSISDLPVYAKNGFRVKVIGDAELSEDDYYVKFETTDGQTYGNGSWVECIAPNVRFGFNSNTLPHILLNTALNTFTLEVMPVRDRGAGDDITNPLPSFSAQTISNLFFFKNRLGFLSNENIILSESGLGALNTSNNLEYNFLRTTVTTLLDSDPIDVSVASSRVTNLKAAKGFQENLVLFSESGQFVLKGGDVLTPKTVSITPITNFSFEDKVDPLPLGSYIYFPFTRGAFTGMREFNINASNDTYDAAEVTEHVPAYIPKDIIDMAGTTSEDMLALLSSDEKGSLYIYNYFWNNNQKVLSAWSKFTFTGEIRGIQFIESTLYAVITNNGETNLVEMPLESGLKDNAGYVTHLDSRVSTTVDIGDNTITLPYTPEDNSVEVYTTDGLALNCTNSGSTVTLSNPVSADTDVWVGIPYTMKYTFSEQLFKAQAGNGKSPSNAAKMMIRNGSLYYDNTSYFKVKVTPKFRDTYENVFTPDVVGSSTIGALSLDSGFYRFPVFTKPQDTTITIENESALPSTFQSAEFESFVHSRSNRYG